MIVTVTRLRNVGVRLKQSELDAAPAIRGDLTLEDWPANNKFHRPIQVARLRHEEQQRLHPALLPPLFDAKVVRITRTQLFIAGLEIHVDGELQQEVAQTWMAAFSYHLSF